MRIVNVNLPSERDYPIRIGSRLFTETNVLNGLDWLAPYAEGGQVAMISDSRVAPLYMNTVARFFPKANVSRWVIPEGEENKTLETVATLYTHLLENQCDRRVLLVALGGGVVGDMVGFAAATYLRGVPYMQIPTSLLAQVDSSVGGKTAVNHPLGKNMIGAFYQPRCVLIDTSTLLTLDPRQFRSGLAEVIKYGAILDEPFLSWLETHIDALNSLNPDSLEYAIGTCCELKARIVAADEREDGIRACLNYGHTFGHAIEAAAGYGNWLHGEAVAVGMLMAARLSVRMDQLTVADYDRLSRLIEAAGLPLKPPSFMTADLFMQYMKRDKKVLAGSLRLVLPRGLGACVITADYPEAELRATLEEFCSCPL